MKIQMVVKTDNAIIEVEWWYYHSRFSRTIYFHQMKVDRLEKRNHVAVLSLVNTSHEV